MQKIGSFLIVLVGLLFLTACGPIPPESQTTKKVKVEKPKPDASAILNGGVTELREEKIFLVTLEFAKEQVTLDLWTLAENAVAAEYRTIIVGEQTFSEYQPGAQVSRVNDSWGLIFNGNFADYVVRVQEKKVLSQYFWVDCGGVSIEIDKGRYDEALARLKAENRQVIMAPFSGVVRNYVLLEPLAEGQFTDLQPLSRYFITMKIENSTFTMDITKQIRNEANTHEITIEVPADVYEKTDKVWDPQLSAGSLVVKGHLSELKGQVIKKWTTVDKKYQSAKTPDGRPIIIPI